MSPKSFHRRTRISSFVYALQGIFSLVRQEPNAKLHAVATLVAIAAGVWRHIPRVEWLALIIVIALVWMAEGLNTCAEMLCDLWCKESYHPQVKIIKDIAAGAVLIAALSAAATGIVIFIL